MSTIKSWSLPAILIMSLCLLLSCNSVIDEQISVEVDNYRIPLKNDRILESLTSEGNLSSDITSEDVINQNDAFQISDWTDDQPFDCYGSETHKIGEGIAEKFEVPYEMIMNWFCDGNQFEDILLALQTSQLITISPDELLTKRVNGQKWDNIWEDLGLINQGNP